MLLSTSAYRDCVSGTTAASLRSSKQDNRQQAQKHHHSPDRTPRRAYFRFCNLVHLAPQHQDTAGEADLDAVCDACLPYLSCRQPISLQEACLR
ncbi:unnamed protein product [Arctogadus glacialis]